MKNLHLLHQKSVVRVALGVLASLLAGQVSLGQGRPAPGQEAEAIRGMIGVGTYKTQAEFKDIKVIKGHQTLYASDFSNGLEDWKLISGQWQVVDGALRQTGNEADTRALFGDPNWSNYTLRLKARKLSGDEGFLIYFGMPDTNTNSRWNVGGWNNTAAAFQAPATSDKQVRGSIATGPWYDIKIELRGNKVLGYINNRLVQTATQAIDTHTLVFSTQAPGKKLRLTEWGLDTAWANRDNMLRGILYMGKDNVDIIRVSFPTDQPLVNGDLPAADDEHFRVRLELAQMAGDKPFTMLPGTDTHPWYKNGNEVIPERWAQAIVASQRHYGKRLESVEPFNEPDNPSGGQGTPQNLFTILWALRHHPDFARVKMCGPSTLNSDAALDWYRAINGNVNIATTHALAGSMPNYIRFYKIAAAGRKFCCNPEVHNLVEVISGAEYGLQRGIWWGTAELARGEFVTAVKGERLAYFEDLPRWTAAGVYRTPSGAVQAFVGASERMATTTNYRFASQDRDVFYDGHGPQRVYTVTISGGTGYWVDQPSVERVVNITWGDDVPPPVGGRYVIVNRHSGKALEVAGADPNDGAGIQQGDYHQGTHQQWEIAPLVAQGGDQSYFTVRAVHSGKSLDTANFNYDEGGKIQQWGSGDPVPKQWYFEYVGDQFFWIRSRWSTKCLGVAGASTSAGASVQQFSRTDAPNLQWRLVPLSTLGSWPLDFVAPNPPTGLTATAKPNAVALRWTANSEADRASYTVFRSTTAGGPYDTIARDVPGTSFIDTGAEERRTSYYVVKAVDRSLNPSAFSNEAGAMPGSGSAQP